jgi:hypothetical protein
MKTKIKTLIHTALVAEAKPIIGHFKLKCIEKIPFNIYKNDNILLIVSGIGGEKTRQALTYALSLYEPKIAINIGIAGCKDKSVKIGSLFCATHKNTPMPYVLVSSCENPATDAQTIHSPLADQESETFLKVMPNGVEKYVFKIVSDYLEPTIPSKAKVGELIQKSINLWSAYAK